jgi:hypothetical protein
MCQASRNPSDRLFRRRCQIIVSSCLVLFLACSQLSLRYPNGAFSLMLAGFAGAFFFAELIGVGLLFFRIRDEFQRILLTRSFVWATIITMAFTTIWGFIELHSHDRLGRLPFLCIPIILICVTAAAKLLIFRQYRSPSE